LASFKHFKAIVSPALKVLEKGFGRRPLKNSGETKQSVRQFFSDCISLRASQ
jgi:hypothetical protein